MLFELPETTEKISAIFATELLFYVSVPEEVDFSSDPRQPDKMAKTSLVEDMTK